jgi:PLP dependent protein
MKKIAQQLHEIRGKVEAAAHRVGRNPQDILIVGVSKNISWEGIRLAMHEKISDFGENKVQEFLKKYDTLSNDCKWHFIGRLQTNKVKFIVDKVDLIHSVDRIELVEEISKRALSIGKDVHILVQVNISGESTKAGVKPNFLLDFLKDTQNYPHVKIKGFMTMAPKSRRPEDVRWIFREMFQLAIDIKEKKTDNISVDFLSMGMSHDFEVAIEEGSNMIRLGQAIFH